MVEWPLTLHLEKSDAPLFRRIASAIVSDIERARLRPGERLPSSRRLAAQLGVNRNTVVTAYEELRAQEWIDIEPARGTFVAQAPPLKRTNAFPSSPGFALGRDLHGDIPIERKPGVYLLLGGVPDLRLLPHRELARAYRRALHGASGRTLLDYGDPQGNPKLRHGIADLLARQRGCNPSIESICVVRGSQQGLYLAARSLISPGDVVAVEACGYKNAWEVLRLAGAELRPISVDGGGMALDQLASLCESEPVRAVCLTPHHQYPTGVSLTATRRRKLLDLARRHRMIVLEDDYDFDFHYNGQPIRPLVSRDDAGVVVYFGTLSKVLAPGLRLGYVVAPAPIARRLAEYRTYVDCQGDHLLETAVAELLEEGVIQRHAERALRHYRRRRDALCSLLGKRMPALEFSVPTGGMAVWARAPGLDTDSWAARALTAGVAIQPESRYRFDGRAGDHVRIGFAACSEDELADAVDILAATYAS